MKMKFSLFAVAASIMLVAAAASAQQNDSVALLSMHDRILEAHRTNNLESWMAIESGDFLSVNGGRVSSPTVQQRFNGRHTYLQSSKFEIYQDRRPPIIRVSADGTLGWVIAEVEVKGVETEDGASKPFHDIWAWVELYQKVDGQWKMVGNASNRRPGG
jgi:hypothetical protein